MTDNTRLRIAMQKSGRLSDDSRELLARCGIKINLHTQRLIAMAENMPIDILRVRDDDIPGLVMDGVVDLNNNNPLLESFGIFTLCRARLLLRFLSFVAQVSVSSGASHLPGN